MNYEKLIDRLLSERGRSLETRREAAQALSALQADARWTPAATPPLDVPDEFEYNGPPGGDTVGKYKELIFRGRYHYPSKTWAWIEGPTHWRSPQSAAALNAREPK